MNFHINCFASINPKVIFTSKSILLISHKDVIPATKKSNVFINSSATVTVSTWVTHCKGLKTKSNSMFQNGPNLKLMQREHNPQDQIRTQLHSH